MSGPAADTIPEYDELKLRVEAHDDDTYDVVAFAADGGTVSGRFERPLSDEALENFILKMPRARSVRSFQSSQMEKARELGRDLFEHLLAGEVGDLYHGARRVADSQGRGLRISLSLTGAPDLLEIPWEFLYDPGDAYFLSQSIFTPVVRSLDLKSPHEVPKVTLPLRVLALVSAPTGSVELDTGREQENLERALEPLIESGSVKLEWLEKATLAELERRIGEPDEMHVVHYIGHGAYDEDGTKSGVLMLEDANGMPHKVTGEELGTMMRDERSLRLVVLNACEGARTSHVDPFSGVSSALLRCGLPAVVGMQAEITDDAAVVFSDRLYTALAQGFPIDAALAQARRAIFAAGHDVEFGTPVLFMRVSDGQIFDVVSTPPPPPVGVVRAELWPDPAAVRAGRSVTWHLQVTNEGDAALSDVLARDSDGETRAGPLALAPGESREFTWSVPVQQAIDERVTVGGRGSDGRLVSTQAGARVEIGGGGRPWWHYGAAGAAAVAVLAAIVLLVAGGGGEDNGGGGGGGGSSGEDVFGVKTDVTDLDVRGDLAAFITPVGSEGKKEIRRLDLASRTTEQLVPPTANHNSIDVGTDSFGKARLAYTRCSEAGVCDVYTKSISGPEKRMPASTEQCSEGRPTMYRGSILYAVEGAGCTPALMLQPPGNQPAIPVAGKTGGSDLNGGAAIWLAGGTLFAGLVGNGSQVTSRSELKPAGSDHINPPLVVENGWAYFIHEQGSQQFIARTKLPLGKSPIEHYMPGGKAATAELAAHYAVTADALYTAGYPLPDGTSGRQKIARIEDPTFEAAD